MNDPALKWLKSQSIKDFNLSHEVCFDFEMGPLAVRTNAMDLIDRLKEHFISYPVKPAIFGTIFQTSIEIYCIGSLVGKAGITLEPLKIKKKNEIHLNTYTRISRKADYYHNKLGDWEILWRPFDIMASFSSHKDRVIRIIVSDFINKKVHAQGEPRLRLLGKNTFPENIDEIIDLIKILYIRINNLFCIHAAAVALNGQGAILTGPSGAGKTTSALSAVRDGFSILSDELVLIENNGHGNIRISGLLVPPNIVGKAPDHIENIEDTLNYNKKKVKNPFQLKKEMIAHERQKSVVPAVILFLEKQINPNADHHLTPLSHQETLVRLMEQVLDLNCFYRREARMDAMISLLDSCDAYRLKLGNNLKSLPVLIRTLFTGIDNAKR